MSNRKGVPRRTATILPVLGIWLGLMLCTGSVLGNGLKDFVLSKLDGKGTVSSIDVQNLHIVIDDVVYVISRHTTVFDVNKKTRVYLDDIKGGDSVGFKAKPLARPTAPYDQAIVKIWILPADR